MPIVELKDVSKLYGFGDATTIALEEVSLSVEKGEFVAIMGASGCGKTTLMNIIGLLDRPTHGEYQLSGRAVAKLKNSQRSRARRDRMGFIFQSFNLLPRLNVLENVALPLAYKGVSQTKRLTQAALMLERVGLGDREYFMPRQLSGGQAQRVAIARALVNNPDIIIADEPTGNLDSGSSRLAMELLSDIHQTGHTILMVTHNPELTRYAERIVYMQDGQIVHDEPSEIGNVPRRARRIMFYKPQTTEDDDLAGVSALMNAMPGREAKAKERKPIRRGKAKAIKKSKKPKKVIR